MILEDILHYMKSGTMKLKKSPKKGWKPWELSLRRFHVHFQRTVGRFIRLNRVFIAYFKAFWSEDEVFNSVSSITACSIFDVGQPFIPPSFFLRRNSWLLRLAHKHRNDSFYIYLVVIDQCNAAKKVDPKLIIPITLFAMSQQIRIGFFLLNETIKTITVFCPWTTISAFG